MRRTGVLILVLILLLGGAVCAQDFQQDELAAREVQGKLAREFRELWLEMSYKEKEAFITGFSMAIHTVNWLDGYMILELELEGELREIIRSRNPKCRPTIKELIRYVDRYYEKEREEYADLGTVLWWFLHEKGRPIGTEDPIREWERNIDERIFARVAERRR